MTDRVIVLIDMDCFYCQVETRLNPALRDVPMAVVQYNQWKGGGIIAVNYEARDRGVTRHMRGHEAKKHCPDIVLVSVPVIRDKADLTRYRDAGREVISVFCQFTDAVQRASVDEAYIDLTLLVNERMDSMKSFNPSKWKSTFVVGYTVDGCNDEERRQNGMKSWLEDCESIHNSDSLRLAVGALIVEEMREAVLTKTGFKCSAGIAHNKILAKLACGLHKPNRQTVLPQESVEVLYKTLPLKKIRNLGGKLGDDIVEKLGCKTMGELAKYSERELQNRYDEKNGTWLYNIARGYDYEPVTARLVSKSIGCCKKFPGKTALATEKDVGHWLNKLAEELSERLLEDEAMNKRRAQLLTVSMGLEINRINTPCSKSVSLSSYSVDKIFTQAEVLLKKVCNVDSVSGSWTPPIKFLGLSAGKFTEISSNKIDKFFKISETPIIKIAENETLVNKEKNKKEEKELEAPRSSFFEKIFANDLQNSGKKLHILPDMTKNDLLADSDESQSSLIKAKKENADLDHCSKVSRDSIKKNLFESTESDFHQINRNPKTIPVMNSLEKNSYEHDANSAINKQKPNRKSGETNKSIASFFDQSTKNTSWVKPEELFPDISQVDEDLLSLLPSSYRNKILKLRQDKSIHNDIKNQNTENNLFEANIKVCGVKDNFKYKENTGDNHFIQEHHQPESRDQTRTGKSSESDIQGEGNSGTSVSFTSIDGNVLNQLNQEPKYVSDFNEKGDNEDNIGSNDSAYLVECDECGEKVSNYEEHMDMHFARKLHKELNSNIKVATVIINKKEMKPKEKRKKISNSKVLPSNSKKLKSIDTFFKR